ncbi:putative LRR receptor-like serine/threonine-protein kinase [Forsythia ovata]|uniref:LRR receptor-like serine/threonine-protein kinase n=1 Tax=Forsythia ovata TaxID=205694 RepID=A0ABD1VMM8_9LAMI
MQVLRKRPSVTIHGCYVHKGLFDIAFSSGDNSRSVTTISLSEKNSLPSWLLLRAESLSLCDCESAIPRSEILSTICHRKLVRIIGCCSNTEFKALILEYMPNGSLERWLYSHNYFLDMLKRLDIAIDVALALEYLHHGLTFTVLHCDLKPSNVLLDQYMVGHVGDFGIAKLFDQGESISQAKTLATIGYMASEYGTEGIVSTSGDVYSYGVMLDKYNFVLIWAHK